MLVLYWRAAIFAAIVALAVNPARAEDPPAKGECSACCNDKDCCKDKKCCACCEDSKCCESKKCCKGTCGACCGCCCAAPSKQVKKATAALPIIVVVPVPMPSATMPVCGYHMGPCGMAMPHPLPPPPPMLTPPGLTPPGLTPPTMPPQTVALPVPLPPSCCTCPPPSGLTASGPMSCPDAAPSKEGMDIDSWLSLLGMVTDLCSSPLRPPSLPSMCMSALAMIADLCGEAYQGKMTPPEPCYLAHPPQYMPPSPPFPLPCEPMTPEAKTAMLLPPPRPADPPTVTCGRAEPLAPVTSAMKVCIAANAADHQLVMSIGDEDVYVSSKKMTANVGDRQLTLTPIKVRVRAEELTPIKGRIRVRAEGLKATADCVRTDRKDCLILEGDAVLRYQKDGQRASVMTGDHIELNLATGSVTIQSADKSSSYYGR